MASSKWRIYFTDSNSHFYVTLSEVAMYDILGNKISTGGTASADSIYGASYAASYAFDNNTSTQWTSAYSSTKIHWIEYDFTSNVTISSVTLRAKSSDVADAPTMGVIQEYLSGEWVDIKSFGPLTWTEGETKQFNIPLLNVGSTAKTIDNNPVDYVAVFNNSNYANRLDYVVPSSDGTWSLALGYGVFDFSFFSSGYDSEISGPHTISEFGISPAIPNIVLGSSSGTMKTVGYAF